jgi:hypothetical protein
VGTFAVGSINQRASTKQMIANVKHIGTWGAHLLGVGTATFGRGGVPRLFEAIHIIGLVAVGAGVLAAAGSLVRGVATGRPAKDDMAEAWRLDDLLLIATCASVTLFVVLSVSNDPGYFRYLTPAVIFGVILAGRLVARLVATVDSTWLLRAGAVVGLAATLAFAAGLAYNLSNPAPGEPFAQLGQFLEAHQLDNGIGDYWSASVTTLGTNSRVRVRPVIVGPGGRIVRYQKNSSETWYAGQHFQFLVFYTALPWGAVSSATAMVSFGVPSHTYVVGTYRVLVWTDPVAVSTTGFA